MDSTGFVQNRILSPVMHGAGPGTLKDPYFLYQVSVCLTPIAGVRWVDTYLKNR